MDVNEIRSDSDALMCTSCKKMLKIPVILPCGHTICKHHVDEAAKNNETNHIICDICLESYEIPANGFVRVRALEIQLENKPNLGQQLLSDFNLARDTCESFGEFLEEFNRIKSDPELKIHTVISDLKNKVDLKREEMKQEIDKKALTVIERLDEFERECKANLPLIESNCKLDEKLKSLRNDLDQTRKSSLTFEIFDKCRKIADESRSAVKELQTELCKFNEHLFVGINCFNSIDLSISNILYPIRMTVNQLSTYKDIIEPKEISIHKSNAFGLEWSLVFKIIQDKGVNTVDIILFANQNARIQNLRTKFDIEILDQFGMGKSLKRSEENTK